jgi:hypothetical protein
MRIWFQEVVAAANLVIFAGSVVVLAAWGEALLR